MGKPLPWHEFALLFVERRCEMVRDGNLEGFVNIYAFLYDNVFSFTPEFMEGSDVEKDEFRESFLSYAQQIGKKEIQEVTELKVLYDKL